MFKEMAIQLETFKMRALKTVDMEVQGIPLTTTEGDKLINLSIDWRYHKYPHNLCFFCTCSYTMHHLTLYLFVVFLLEVEEIPQEEIKAQLEAEAQAILIVVQSQGLCREGRPQVLVMMPLYVNVVSMLFS